eukprot:scaffold1446_cov391-Prasinococcus_capsulatus_cf.AAC.19
MHVASYSYEACQLSLACDCSAGKRARPCPGLRYARYRWHSVPGQCFPARKTDCPLRCAP